MVLPSYCISHREIQIVFVADIFDFSSLLLIFTITEKLSVLYLNVSSGKMKLLQNEIVSFASVYSEEHLNTQ